MINSQSVIIIVTFLQINNIYYKQYHNIEILNQIEASLEI